MHALRCSSDDGEIVEVSPPAWATEDAKPGLQPAEAKFFPLVSAAHEFKTPLVVMLGYADLVLVRKPWAGDGQTARSPWRDV